MNCKIISFDTDSSRGNAGQSRIDVDDSEGDTSFTQPGSSFRGANDDTSASHLVQDNSMDGQSLDNSMQMGSSRIPDPLSMNSNSSTQNANLDQNAPTSFRSDMFPRSGQSSESDAVSFTNQLTKDAIYDILT